MGFAGPAGGWAEEPSDAFLSAFGDLADVSWKQIFREQRPLRHTINCRREAWYIDP